MSLSARADGRGHWPAGKSRHADGIDASQFFAALSREVPLARIAAIMHVSEKSVRRWRDGQRKVSQSAVELLIDRLWPGVWSRQARLHGDGDVGPDTRTAGVGEYTRRSAQCGPCG